ncbi:MAG: radical SAM protein [Candidatus Heimdallarchaeota archaeon]|nr:MAG: radical SAM protein [Candidatus Heimdallarchaeota archaeon]
MEIRYQAVESRSKILNRYSHPDPWFWVSGSVNPYRGCEHNCTYCDGKAEWYRIKNFGTHIRVKEDASIKYEKELTKNGLNPEFRKRKDNLEGFLPQAAKKTKIKQLRKPIFPIAVGGGVCDVYQPAEKKFKITRKILEKNRDFGVPVMVLTKSTLVLRDLDLLTEINRLSYANVSFSISLNDEKTKKIFEPRSQSSTQRFQALKTVRKNNLHGGIVFMPILPGIGDSEENIKQIVQKSKEAQAEFVLPGGLTLKPGRNKQEFFDVIQKYFPDLVSLYQDLYSNDNKYGNPNPSYKDVINVCKLSHKYCRKVGIPDRVPRYIPPGVPQKNFLVSTILHNLAYYYQWVDEKHWRSVLPFTKAAKVIELLSSDLSEMKNELIRRGLKLPRKVFSVVSEVLETGKSSDLMKYQDPENVLLNKEKVTVF